jgi:N6-adenosine-specific RNA methylase IME4
VDFGLWPNNRYGVIYADPPWNFETYSDKGTGRGAVSHYDTLTIEDLMTMPVADLAAKDCALFLWCIDTHLPQGLELLRAWGFDYKTVGFVWAKKNKKADSYFMGLGKWARTNPEICLLATRGKPKPLSRSVRKLVVERLRENGRKPERVRDDIKELVAGPYLELFARQTAEGWDCWGDQTTLFDQ